MGPPSPDKSPIAENDLTPYCPYPYVRVVFLMEANNALIGQQVLPRLAAFRPHLAVGLALSKKGENPVRLPAGVSPREA